MPPETKICPYCGGKILAVAKKCRHCEEYFDPKDRLAERPGAVERMLTPAGRAGSAIAAGYMGLLSCFPLVGLVPAILGIVFGIMALKAIARDPSLSGKGRAWFGIICGILCLVLWTVGLIALVVNLITEQSRKAGHG